ncbi:hypothetical protein Tb09.142.0430 [Trypanosoma brucei brucei TREU927]|uniref:Uncharacterized protein n=1 Tax=Trypanosoma brucei brucei (strain 927/4 GUTat10.1) TaxID=185431 RepID=Q38G30_TRYB2|nr:hypothetical protein Tb09.142.0430 [Trypanosoma brucei brucei TREU927]EAN76240.1 hypothetical protein Tb09.142.0430 [Trypanosoma brucei brucei TREU927]
MNHGIGMCVAIPAIFFKTIICTIVVLTTHTCTRLFNLFHKANIQKWTAVSQVALAVKNFSSELINNKTTPIIFAWKRPLPSWPQFLQLATCSLVFSLQKCTSIVVSAVAHMCVCVSVCGEMVKSLGRIGTILHHDKYHATI